MSPVKFHLDPNFINGQRPSPLKINKESHLIHKSSSSSSSSNSSSSTSAIPPVVCGAKQQQQQQQRNHPVIIYTHSPKVIHTQAKDFMALVQKLTGLSRSNDDEAAPSTQQGEEGYVHKGSLKSEGGKINNTKPSGNDDNESSSISTNENCGGGGAGAISPILKPPNNPSFADIPLFTPTSADFFCSPRPVYRYSDSVYVSPNMGNPISPSLFEFMKGLPEY